MFYFSEAASLVTEGDLSFVDETVVGLLSVRPRGMCLPESASLATEGDLTHVEEMEVVGMMATMDMLVVGLADQDVLVAVAVPHAMVQG